VEGCSGSSSIWSVRGMIGNGKEAGGLTVMVTHPPLEDISLEEAPDLFVEEVLSGERTAPDIYEVPVAEVEHLERETESYLAWVVVLGFVAYAIVLYWAHKCERRGGDASIKYSILKGFKVRCVK
jgi:hypothetical protein